MRMDVFEFSGRSLVVTYEGLTATNVYSSDGRSLTYEITEGSLKGNRATVDFTWHQLRGKTYAFSWQEANGATVVHIDDFEAGRSLSFFTTPNAEFFRLEGALEAR
ncbi:MoaF-related domain-containing protein [Paraburkholderia fynbosensis]|uniref:MoaF-like domain-containing protein n=1 Tax=Paraburkholderia fynbosensis TaxID=1200993 RepID=A0A6J5GWC5_9BURK|nr:adenylate cyclase [Paraburkholderia fynbosensis]CAB3807427.1 hypothetical protein LMG27177_06333 [Paraburkholderia fynbosensis]